jgi:hypothetical protein
VIKTNTENPISKNFNTYDELYENNTKKLVDLCTDNENNQVCILTKFLGREKPEYKVEVYVFNEQTNEMTLTKILNISQTIGTTQPSQCEFSRIYLDEIENMFVVIDSNNHKV